MLLYFTCTCVSLCVSLCGILTYLVARVQAEEIDELTKIRKSQIRNYIYWKRGEPLYISVATTRIDVLSTISKSSKSTTHHKEADYLHNMPAL